MKNVLVFLSAFLLSRLPVVFACVGCREPGVGNIDEPQTVLAGVGFSLGVLCMLVVVFAVVGTMVFLIVRTCRSLDEKYKLP
jgi:large-conductance mechanosensitive channel